jgi:hypothetical protein
MIQLNKIADGGNHSVNLPIGERMNALANIDKREILELCRQHGLSEFESTAAMMILNGKSAFPLQNYNQAIRRLIAEVVDRVRERNGEFKGEIGHAHY